MCLVFTSVITINLRLLGVGRAGRSVSELTNTLTPIIWVALLVMLLTGTVQTIAEPVRQFITPAFWAKMAMIVVVATTTSLFARSVRANPSKWDDAARRPASGKVLAVVTTVLWVGIVVCGRLIGYTWYYYQ